MITPFATLTPTKRAVSVSATIALLFTGWLVLHKTNPIIPSPMAVVLAFMVLLHDGLLLRLWESYALNVLALGISTTLSFVGAYLTVVGATSPSVEFLSKLRFLGFTGLVFIFGMYAEGRALQVWLLVFGISTFFVTSMMAVVAAVPQSKLDHARTLRMGPWRTLWEVVVRGTLSEAIDVLRQSAAIGWVMLTMVEGLVRSQGGVGVLLIDLNRRLALDGIFAIAIVITLIGIAQDYVINQIRLMVCPHVR